MAERPTPPPRRRPVFAYVASIDPALSTFGWKIVGLAHLAMLLPLVGAFLPHDTPTHWGSVALVGALAGVVGLANLVSFVRMIRSDGYESPTPRSVLIAAVLATIAAALLSYAIGDAAGIYRPLIFVPLLLVAMIGNRWMIVVTWLTATVAVAASAVAVGPMDREVATVVLSYGVVWGIASIMVHLLAVSALHSDGQMSGLAEVAGIAAQANSLVEGTERVLPVMAEWSGARRAGAFRVIVDTGPDGGLTSGVPEALASWPTIAEIDPPDAAVLAEAHAHQGVALVGDGAVMLAESGDGQALAVVLDAIDQPVYDRLMVRFNLERMVAQVRVLVDRSRYVARLETLGHTDGLTGLPNRRALDQQLVRALAATRRRGSPLTVVMIDLDQFKDFNDTNGHLAGDDLLRSYATRLRSRLRTADFVARYGGEEFCVLLPDTDAAGAERLFDELHRAFRRAEDLRGVTFSAGVAGWDGTEDVEQVVGRADRALYAAKAAGRDRTVVDPGDDGGARPDSSPDTDAPTSGS